MRPPFRVEAVAREVGQERQTRDAPARGDIQERGSPRRKAAWNGDFDRSYHRALFDLPKNARGDEEPEGRSTRNTIELTQRYLEGSSRLRAVTHVWQNAEDAAARWATALAALLVRDTPSTFFSPSWLKYTIDRVGSAAMKSFMSDGRGDLNRIFTPLIFGAGGFRSGDADWSTEHAGFSAVPFLEKQKKDRGAGKKLPDKKVTRPSRKAQTRGGGETFLDFVRFPKGDSSRAFPEEGIRAYLADTRSPLLESPPPGHDVSQIDAGRKAFLKRLSEFRDLKRTPSWSEITREDHALHRETWQACASALDEVVLAARLVNAVADATSIVDGTGAPDVARTELDTARAKGWRTIDGELRSDVPDWVASTVTACATRMTSAARANYYLLVTTLGTPPVAWSHVRLRAGQKPTQRRGLDLAGADWDARSFGQRFEVSEDSSVALFLQSRAEMVGRFSERLSNERHNIINDSILKLPDPLAKLDRYSAKIKAFAGTRTVPPLMSEKIESDLPRLIQWHVNVLESLCEELESVRVDGGSDARRATVREAVKLVKEAYFASRSEAQRPRRTSESSSQVSDAE